MSDDLNPPTEENNVPPAMVVKEGKLRPTDPGKPGITLTDNGKPSIGEILIPPSDAATALERMPPEERLPHERRPIAGAIRDVPERVKDAIRKIGTV